MLNKYHFGNHEFADDPLQDLIADFKLEGKKLGAVELLMIHDKATQEYYPVYIYAGDDRELKIKEYSNGSGDQEIVDQVKI